MFPVIRSTYSAPPDNTHIETVARAFSARDGGEIISAGKYADPNCFTAFVEDCRALLAFFGLADSKVKLEADKKKGVKQLTLEIANKNIENGRIVLNSMSFIEEKEHGQSFIYIENDFGKVKITRSMTMKQFQKRACDLSKNIAADNETLASLTTGFSDEDELSEEEKYCPKEVFGDDFTRRKDTSSRSDCDDNDNGGDFEVASYTWEVWWEKIWRYRPIG